MFESSVTKPRALESLVFAALFVFPACDEGTDASSVDRNRAGVVEDSNSALTEPTDVELLNAAQRNPGACDRCTDVDEHCPDIEFELPCNCDFTVFPPDCDTCPAGWTENTICKAACEIEKHRDLIGCLKDGLAASGTGGLCVACVDALVGISFGALVALCKEPCGQAVELLEAAYESCTNENEAGECDATPIEPPPLADTWIGINYGDGNAIFPLNGTTNPAKAIAPWKYCPANLELAGAGGDEGQTFWICTTPAGKNDTFYISRFVNNAAFVYRIEDGSVEKMGGIEYKNCPFLSTPIGERIAAGGFWACRGGGISPPPVAVTTGTLLRMIPPTPHSTAQHWLLEPIGASPSRAPADLAASGAGLMIINRRTGMALDDSEMFAIGPWWIAALYDLVWGGKGQVWTLHKHPDLELYVIRDEASKRVLDYAWGPDGAQPVLQARVENSLAQLWDLQNIDDHYYMIVNHYSKQAIDY